MNRLKIVFSKPYVIFTLFFSGYLACAILLSSNNLVEDEGRYIRYAKNLVNGFYSEKGTVDLWNGPGYPLLLMLFMLPDLNFLFIKIFNAVMLTSSVVYLFNTIRIYTKPGTALKASVLFGCYYPMYIFLPLIMSEILAIFLVCAFSYHFIMSYSTLKVPHILLSAIFLALLTLTKVIFAYVLLIIIVFTLTAMLINRKKVKNILIIWILSLLICLPYLFYTYNLTGKFYFWANSGGSSLYWMSTPYAEEYGDWFSTANIQQNPKLLKNHKEFWEYLSHVDPKDKDAVLKDKAIENIMRNPKKYFMNWIANWGRLIFSYPYSYTSQKLSTYFYLPNIIFFVLMVFSIYPFILLIRVIPFEIILLCIFGGTYLVLSSFLSAYPRQFFLAVPLIITYITIIISQIKIEVKIPMKDNKSELYNQVSSKMI